MVDFRVEGSASLDPEHIIADVDEIMAKLDELKDKVDEVDVKLDELSHKNVDIEVLVNGQDKLDELRLLIDDLDSRPHTLTIDVNINGIDKLELLRTTIDEMDAADHTLHIEIDIAGEDKLEELEEKLILFTDQDWHVTVPVDIEGFDETMAKLVALDEELKRKKDDLDTVSKAMRDLGSSTDSAGNSANKFKFSILMLAPALIPLLPLVSILAGGVLGLASAFYAMSVPLLGLALSVKGFMSDFTNMESGLSQQAAAALQAADGYQQIYDVLQANSTAFQQMDSLEKQAAVNYELLKHALDDFQTAVEPSVLPMMIQGFKLLTQILQILVPMVNTAASAIDNWLTDFSARLKDPTFTKFFTDVEKNLGTLVEDWLGGILNIIEGFTALMDAFMPLGVDMSNGFLRMTQSFDTWAQHVAQSKGFQNFVAFVEKEGPVLLDVLGQIILLIGHLFAAIGSNTAAGGLLSTLDKILHTLNNFMSAHPGVAKIAADLLLFGVAAAKLAPLLGPIIAFLSTPVGAIVGVVVALGAAFIYAYTHSKTFHDWVVKNLGPMWKDLVRDAKGFVDFFKGALPDLEKMWKTYGQNILNIVKDAVNGILLALRGLMQLLKGLFEVLDGVLTGKWSKIWKGIEDIFSGAWKIIYGIGDGAAKIIIQLLEMLGKMIWNLLKTPLDAIGNYFRQKWDEMIRDVEAFFNQSVSNAESWGAYFLSAIVTWGAKVMAWFENLPASIVGWVGDLWNTLWNAGVQVITGLVNGITSSVESVLKPTLNWVTTIIGMFKGPPSKDRVLLYNSGQLIMRGLVNGINSMVPHLQSSLTGVTKNIENTFGKQYTTSISAKINSAVQDANYAVRAYNQGGMLPNAGSQTQVTFAAGAIQINNPKAEQPGITLTRALQGAAKFGTIQAPTGYSRG